MLPRMLGGEKEEPNETLEEGEHAERSISVHTFQNDDRQTLGLWCSKRQPTTR